MTNSIRHVGLVVNNLDASLHFWCEIMGFVVVRTMEESGPHIDAMMGIQGVQVTTVKISAADGNILELLKFHSHPHTAKWEGQPYSTGLTHIALTVQDLKETLCRLETANIIISNEPQLSSDGNVKVVYITGPEGVLIELVEIINRGNTK